jgi:hypothetical protein
MAVPRRMTIKAYVTGVVKARHRVADNIEETPLVAKAV